MKPLLLICCLLLFRDLQSQVPYKLPSFADDVTIHDKSDRNQRIPGFCSAYNGRMFCSYYYYSPLPNEGADEIRLKSDTEGVDWDIYLDLGFNNRQFITKSYDLLSLGNSDDSLKIFRLKVDYSLINNKIGFGFDRWNGITLQFEDAYLIGLPQWEKYACSMACDFLFPASGANPSSLVVAWTGSYNKDTLIAQTSGEGLFWWVPTWQFIRVYGAHPRKLGKVDVSYARSSSVSIGKYFITWEVKNNENSASGNIYVSHNISGYNSNYSPAVKLNDFLPGSENLLRNPKIACQVSNTDNDSADITSVILAEKYDAVTERTQIVGFYTNRASTSTVWHSFTIGNPGNNSKQPDIAFNHFDSTFMIVYFDSTEKKIPYLTHNFNFTEPVNWTVVKDAVNDSDAVSDPSPTVKLCYDTQMGAVVWASDNEEGNGVIKFDAPFHYYQGTTEITPEESIKCYPNPATSSFTVRFETTFRQPYRLIITNATGQTVTVKEGISETGENHVLINDDLSAGIYLVNCITKNGSGRSKVVVD